MLTDSITMVSGSEIFNIHIEDGDVFPDNPTKGRLFYLNVALDPSTNAGLYTYNGTSWETGSINEAAAGTGLTFNSGALDVNLGAGITEVPVSEVGLDLYPTGGLILTIDGTTESTDSAAQLALTPVGTPGTYNNVTTDIYGRVTAGSSTGSAELLLTEGLITSNTLTTTLATENQILDSFDITLYRTAKYHIQVTSGTSYHSTDVHMIHNGTTSLLSESNTIFTDTNLMTFNTDVFGTDIRLLISPVNADNVIKFIVIYTNL